jgi:hypothetical protein
VKFSETVTVAVVPEISRKEKVLMKRKPYIGHMDPRRELAESLPLCHPNDDYLGLFSPSSEKKKEPGNKNNSNDKKKPAIKVVHFGVV